MESLVLEKNLEAFEVEESTKNHKSHGFTKTINSISKGGNDLISKAKNTVNKSQKTVFDALDVNGDGDINIEDIIILGMRTPGIKIDRAKFLTKELTRKVDAKTVEKAINENPAKAGILQETINDIAEDIISFERNCASGISAALSAPGGFTMIATLPADLTQYYGYMLRVAQKLMYLYGFQQINVEENEGVLDTGTMNTLILCLGAMYGVAGANTALKAMSVALAKGVSKKFMQTAVTKGVVYPIVKNICKWFGINLTKKICTNFFSKAIPIVGGAIGGVLTFATFHPCCMKLKETLENTMLSDTNYVPDNDVNELAESIIDAGFKDEI